MQIIRLATLSVTYITCHHLVIGKNKKNINIFMRKEEKHQSVAAILCYLWKAKRDNTLELF